MAKLKDLRLPPTRKTIFEFTRKTRGGEEVRCVVAIQLLTSKQLDLARAESMREARSLFKAQEARDELTEKSDTFEEILLSCRNTEFLQWALCDPDPKYDDATEYPMGAPPWSTSLELREILSNVEISLLARAYEDHEYQVSQFKHDLTPAEYDEMLKLSAAATHVDPQRYYGTNLRIRMHALLCKEVLDSRAQIAVLEAEVQGLKESLEDALAQPPDEE